MDNSNPSGRQSNFFGTKVSVPGINVNSAGDNELILKDDYSTRTYYGTDGNPVLQIGKLPTGGYGLRFPDMNGIGIAQAGQFPDGSTGFRVAPAGIEVATASTNQLIFNSAQDIFKIVKKLTVPFTFTGTGSTTTTAVSAAHNLGYLPLTFNEVTITTNTANNETGIFQMPYIGQGTTTGTGPAFIISAFVKQSNVTTSTISFGIGIIGSLTIAGTITCYVLQETAS